MMALPTTAETLRIYRRCEPCRLFDCRPACRCGCHQPRRCQSCHALIWWGTTPKGKRCPYDFDPEGRATQVSHFATCPHARTWSHRRGERA
jgi:hypothetical protein